MNPTPCGAAFRSAQEEGRLGAAPPSPDELERRAWRALAERDWTRFAAYAAAWTVRAPRDGAPSPFEGLVEMARFRDTLPEAARR